MSGVTVVVIFLGMSGVTVAVVFFQVGNAGESGLGVNIIVLVLLSFVDCSMTYGMSTNPRESERMKEVIHNHSYDT